MAARVKLSQVIDRSVADVFRFFATDHVRNHPRWDQHMQLEKTSDSPIGVGTIIRRINSRSGSPIEGTIEVVGFEPNQLMATVIHDGAFETRSRVLFEATGENSTILTFDIEFPALDESADTSAITRSMQGSLDNIKKLIESDS